MIPKYQRILFWTLAGAILLMALVLLRGCEQAREKLTRQRDITPLTAPIGSPSESVTLLLANDSDGSITPSNREVALPTEATARARSLLTRLIAEYTYKGSPHPLESGPAIDDVFLLPLPLRGAGGEPGRAAYDLSAPQRFYPSGAQLAVVNLHGSFADNHPSGIDAEDLTIQSIVGTLHAQFPDIEEVRFLVDGQPRETLNGHADLLRTYPCLNTTTRAGTVR